MGFFTFPFVCRGTLRKRHNKNIVNANGMGCCKTCVFEGSGIVKRVEMSMDKSKCDIKVNSFQRQVI